MKTRNLLIITAVIIAVFVSILPLAAQDKVTDLQYSGMVAVTGGAAAGKTADIDIFIDRFSTDDEANGLVQVLSESGMIAMQQAMRKMDVGRISLNSRPGIKFAVARLLKQGDATIIRLYFDRNVTYLERIAISRSEDYPFSMIELQVNEKGEGQGVGITAAKIDIDKEKKQFVVESFGRGEGVVNIMNVRQLD